MWCPRGFPWMPAGPAPCFWRDARRTSSTGSDLHSCLGVYGSQRGRRDSLCPKAAASRAGEGGRRSAVGPADPRVQPEHRQGLMTISMPDRFRLAAPRGRRRRIGMAMGLLEQSRLASCPRPGRTKSTPLTRRRIAVWRLEWPPRVARARRDGRDGSCASGRPRDVGHRCERWRALERERGAAFEPPLASQVLLGIKQLEPERPGAPAPTRLRTRSFRSSWCRGVCHPRIETPAGPKKGQCLLRGRRGDPFSARATS